MKKKQKAASYPVSNFLQTSYIAVYITSLLFSVIQIVSWIISQYHYNHNLSAYLLISLQLLFMPIVMFALAFFTGSRKETKKARVFEALLLSSIGVFIVGIVQEIPTLPFIHIDYGGTSYWGSVWYTLSLFGVGLIFYTIGLIYYRKYHKA